MTLGGIVSFSVNPKAEIDKAEVVVKKRQRNLGLENWPKGVNKFLR